MNNRKVKTIGILGGMGPEATLYLYGQIIINTSAEKDQDHIPVIINSNPQTPDRTRNIVYGEESPLPYLVQGAKLLEKAGASLLLIPCNTAHYYIDDISAEISVPIISMIDTTSATVAGAGVKKAGILATTGSIQSGLYQKMLQKYGVEVVLPNSREQEEIVMEAVYGKKGVKAGYKRGPGELLKRAAALLEDRGAECIIAGCTEIPLVLKQSGVKSHLYNPMELLAKAAIKIAREEIDN